ncbi:LppP/LprE family lipoprotein [Corynebacterium nuruki]|uniref:LppP/LprE family lipoprotein n=1 Tax=Corynebacterium nuruki TaxID=1032851 RepID=UPI0002485E11|nr:LppP/LprE family lipoprotein [Corynebacterium nuruki]
MSPTTSTAVPTTAARRLRRTAPAVLAAGVLLLGACSSGDSDGSNGTTSAAAPGTVTQTVTAPAPTRGGGAGGPAVSPSPVAPADPDDPGGPADPADPCSGLDAAQAAARWAGDVPPNAEGYPWATGSVETDGYDACAALSWMILPIQGGTASSPYQIMLFHNGRYIGTATSEAYGFHPTVQRTDANQIQVTWHWPRKGESNAGASGTSTATFTWNDATGQVDMTGDVPPV